METDVVRKVLSEVIPLTDEHSDDVSLSDVGLDSIAMVRVVVLLEQRTGSVVPRDRLTPQAFATVNTLTAVLGGAGNDLATGGAADTEERPGVS